MSDRTSDRWLGFTSPIMEGSRTTVPRPGTAASHRSGPIARTASSLGSEEQRDERAVVEAVLAGDREAYRRLVERESAPVVRACHRILGDIHEAEDAAQEAFVTAYRSLASWRGDGPFGAWLTRIAVRIALREVGKRRTVTWLEPTRPGGTDGADRGSAAADAQAMAARSRTDPAMLALRGERESDVRVAVAALPEPYREVVILRFFGEMSLAEIARETERPVATVKTHLRRGLMRLRGTVEPGTDR